MSSVSIQHLLVIRLGALGDCMHVLPSLEAVASTYPRVQQRWLVQSVFHPLLAGHAHCWPGEKPKGIWPRVQWLWQTSRQLAAAGVDGVVNLQPSVLTHVLTWLILLRQGLLPWGRYAVYAKQKLSVTGLVERSTPRRHAIEDFYQPFRRLLPHLATTPSSQPCLALPAEESSITTPAIALIVGVGGKRPNRAWPIPYWQALIMQLCDELTLAGTTVVLIGGPEEVAIGESVLASLPSHCQQRVRNTVGQLTLPQLAHALRQCRVVVGGDTGPLHVAAASGCPQVIGLYGPTSVARTGPRGPRHCQAITPPQDAVYWPCEQPACTHPQPCMADILPEDVAQAVIAAHNKTPAR